MANSNVDKLYKVLAAFEKAGKDYPVDSGKQNHRCGMWRQDQ